MVVTTFLATLFYYQFDQALKERVLLQLSSVKQLKQVKIKAEITERISLFDSLRAEDLNGEKPVGIFEFSVSKVKPTKIKHYQIPPFAEWTETSYLIDLTNQHTTDEITIGLVKKRDNTYYVAIAQIPEIQEILLERTGLGETGESYLVGDDYRLKSKSRFKLPQGNETIVNTKGVRSALAGKAGEDSFLDYRGIHVYSSYDRITFNGLTWVMLSEINYDEAMAPIIQLRENLLIILAVIIAFILIVSYYISSMIVSPIINMEEKLIRMAEGIQESEFPDKNRKDEIGLMFKALNNLIQALGNTIKFADEIGSGNFTADFKPLGPHDKLGASLVEMKERLKQYQENELMHQKENQQSIISGEENERSRLAKELHDGLGPLLTTLRLDIQSTSLDKSLKSQLLEKLDYTIQEVRNMSNNLMPSVLKDFGVGEAITNMVDEINNSSPVEIRYKHDISPTINLDDQIQISIYRIIQEAVNNALRHAKATEIKLSLTCFEDHIDLFISDNGQGFDLNNLRGGNGIRNMKERVKLSSGNIQFSSDDSGTTIEIEIPI